MLLTKFQSSQLTANHKQANMMLKPILPLFSAAAPRRRLLSYQTTTSTLQYRYSALWREQVHKPPPPSDIAKNYFRGAKNPKDHEGLRRPRFPLKQSTANQMR